MQIQEVVTFTVHTNHEGRRSKEITYFWKKTETSRQAKDIRRVFDHARLKISKSLQAESEVIEGISDNRVYPYISINLKIVSD